MLPRMALWSELWREGGRGEGGSSPEIHNKSCSVPVKRGYTPGDRRGQKESEVYPPFSLSVPFGWVVTLGELALSPTYAGPDGNHGYCSSIEALQSKGFRCFNILRLESRLFSKLLQEPRKKKAVNYEAAYFG